MMHKCNLFRSMALACLFLLIFAPRVRAQNDVNLEDLEPVDSQTRASMMLTLQGQEKAIRNGVWIYTVQNVTSSTLENFDNALFVKGLEDLKESPGFKSPVPPSEISANNLITLKKTDQDMVLLGPAQLYAMDENGREAHEFVRYCVANHGRVLYQEIVKRVSDPAKGASEVVVTEYVGAQATTKKKVGPGSYDWATPEGQLIAWQFGMGFDPFLTGPYPISRGVAKWDSLKYATAKVPGTLTVYCEQYTGRADGKSLGYMQFTLEGTKKAPILRPIELALAMNAANADKHVVVQSWVYGDPTAPIVPKNAVMYKKFSKEDVEAKSSAIAYEVKSFIENSTLEENLFANKVAAGTPIQDDNLDASMTIGQLTPPMMLEEYFYEYVEPYWDKEDADHYVTDDPVHDGIQVLSIHSRSSITLQEIDITNLRLFYSFDSTKSYINDYYYYNGYPWGISLDRDVHMIWDECADLIDQNYLGAYRPDRWTYPEHDGFGDGEITDGWWSMTYSNYTTPQAGDYVTTMTFTDNCVPDDLGSIPHSKCSNDQYTVDLPTTATLVDCFITPLTITLRSGEITSVTAHSIPNDVKGTWHWNTTTPEHVVFLVGGQEVSDVYWDASEIANYTVWIKGKAPGYAEICVEFMSEPDDWGRILLGDDTYPYEINIPNDRRGFGQDQKYFTVY